MFYFIIIFYFVLFLFYIIILFLFKAFYKNACFNSILFEFFYLIF